jgi:Ni,Fe-hydrogenase III component G
MNTEETLQLAADILTNWAWETEASRPDPNRLDVWLSTPDDLVPMVVGLRVKRLGYLATITGLDEGPEAGRIEVLYHFCTGEAVVTLRVRLPRENPAVPTLSEIIPSAEVFERELAEMLGVTIRGLRHPDHLYLPEDWPDGVFPLRKDCDLTFLRERSGHANQTA